MLFAELMIHLILWTVEPRTGMRKLIQKSMRFDLVILWIFFLLARRLFTSTFSTDNFERSSSTEGKIWFSKNDVPVPSTLNFLEQTSVFQREGKDETCAQHFRTSSVISLKFESVWSTVIDNDVESFRLTIPKQIVLNELKGSSFVAVKAEHFKFLHTQNQPESYWKIMLSNLMHSHVLL